MRARLSIGTRLALRYTIATSILFAIVTIALYARVSQTVLDGANFELRRRTNAISEMIARHPGDLAVLGEFIEAEIASSPVDLRLAIDLYDEQRNLILRRDILAPFPTEELDWELLNSSRLRFYREEWGHSYPFFVMLGRHEGGFSRVAISGEPYLRELAQMRATFLVIVPLGLVLTALVSTWLSRQTLAPIVDITTTARGVSSAASNEWIPARGTGDELDELATTLNQMLEKIRDSAGHMRRFAAQAAHELRTPISVTRTRIEVTLQESRSSEEYASVLSHVLEDIRVLEGGIEAVLGIARSEAGLSQEQMQEVDLSALLAEIAEFFRPLAQEKGLELELEPLDALLVLGERTWLNRLFSNLVDNAIKFSDSEGIIDIRASSTGEMAEVSIRDTGIGIAEEDQAKLFDRFYRGREARAPGQGLGLALSMEITRAHGGLLEYEKPLGGGALFRVILPLHQSSATR